jgi:uncharacterized protein
MAQERLRYDRMIDEALRGVVRSALIDVAKRSLPGNHHFYITFRTDHADVQIADWLHQQYPEAMTIVLQYQFWGLEVEENSFAVTLSFNNQQERLFVPFAAITAFHDPAVNFGLEFQTRREGEEETKPPKASVPAKLPEKAESQDKGAEGGKDEKVVALDAFRKK